MKNDRKDTQGNIIKLIENARKQITKYRAPGNWNKYYGDVCVRILSDFISKSLPRGYKVSIPNAYIEGFPVEFDLLIIDRNAKPLKHTNAYPRSKVKCGIEIKARGVFGGHTQLKKTLSKIKANFDQIKKPNKSPIPFVYLTYQEVISPKRRTSIRYLEETVAVLKPYKVFCLKDSRTNNLIEGQWEDFITYLKKAIHPGDR